MFDDHGNSRLPFYSFLHLIFNNSMRGLEHYSARAEVTGHARIRDSSHLQSNNLQKNSASQGPRVHCFRRFRWGRGPLLFTHDVIEPGNSALDPWAGLVLLYQQHILRLLDIPARYHSCRATVADTPAGLLCSSLSKR